MSASSEIRILFVGDMHLGKRPSRVPSGFPVSELGPRQAWQRVIQCAIDKDVQAVALAGDLVHRANSLFEAYGQLDQGLRRLRDAGIKVCAVAGNHDTDTLPQLAAELDNFELLGPRGTWSAMVLTTAGTPPVRVMGWSFPSRHHSTSPLATAPPPVESGTVTLGLLHCDLDARDSQYAPVSSQDLLQIGYDRWYLGHIHVPGPVPEDNTPFYLGSVTGLNPKEQGAHGPVLVRVSHKGEISQERLPLAPLRWEEIKVDCQGLTEARVQLRGHLLKSIKAFLGTLKTEMENTQALGLRLILVGQVEDPAGFQAAVRSLDLSELTLGIDIFVDKVTSQVTGTFDLVGLSHENHPAGIMARQILLLEDPSRKIFGIDDPRQAQANLLTRARRVVEVQDNRPVFSTLNLDPEGDSLSDEELKTELLSSARESLIDLLAHHGGGHATD